MGQTLFQAFKRVLVGSPIPSAEAHRERLTKTRALATFSSDPLSSVAYATEEILLVLMLVGSSALHLSVPISLAIISLLVIVVISYRQTIWTYPSGGGAYIVAKENLGEFAGLVAGAALLIDYVLTVAVSVAAGIAALTSAFPSFQSHNVLLSILAILVLTAMNLRGIRDSSTVFSIPTYAFVFGILSMLGVAVFKTITGDFQPLPSPVLPMEHPLTLFVLLRAFSSGCTALTGVEAVSNGIPAFQPPESKNAATTLVIMVILSITMFFGITYFANFHGIIPNPNETVVSQLARSVFGGSFAYYFVQFTTMGILVLAANTSYADFPRLASLLAKDRFLPRQLSVQGDRLVFSNGILILSLLSAALIVLFRADTHALIPLYCVGVFLSFTLSQFGMVRHWFTEGKPGWLKHSVVNLVGGTVTGVVTIVFTVTKFTHGAWIITLVIPLLVWMFRKIHGHYFDVARQLSLVHMDPSRLKQEPLKHTALIPVSGVHRGILDAIHYAKSTTSDVRAVYVELDPEISEWFQKEWQRLQGDIPVVILKSPYRSILGPLINYINDVQKLQHDQIITIVIPEFVTSRWWHGLLHNQTAFFLRAALIFKPRVVVTSVRYHLR